MSLDFIPEVQPIVVVDRETNAMPSSALRQRILELKDQIGSDYTELCEHLYRVQAEGLYEMWGYGTFRQYAASELEFRPTKALYLAQIWKKLNVGQSPDVFEKVMQLGWSKAKELSRVVTAENVDEWVEKAKILSVDSLVKEVQTVVKRAIPNDAAEALANEQNVVGTPLEEEIKQVTMHFKYQDYLTLMQVIELVRQREILPPDVPVAAVVSLVCAEFLATNASDEVGAESIVSFLKKFETACPAIGVVVVNKANGELLSGAEHLAG